LKRSTRHSQSGRSQSMADPAAIRRKGE